MHLHAWAERGSRSCDSGADYPHPGEARLATSDSWRCRHRRPAYSRSMATSGMSMGAAVRFDPWAVLQEIKGAPAATAAAAAFRAALATNAPAEIAPAAEEQANAASAAIAARGSSKNPE